MSELTGKAGLIMNTRGNDPIIVLKDVKKIYQMGSQEVRAIDGFSVTIDPGEYVAIMGPSGSGKSTMMNIIGCLDIPSEGTYCLNSNLVSEMDDDELDRRLTELERDDGEATTLNPAPGKGPASLH